MRDPELGENVSTILLATLLQISWKLSEFPVRQDSLQGWEKDLHAHQQVRDPMIHHMSQLLNEVELGYPEHLKEYLVAAAILS